MNAPDNNPKVRRDSRFDELLTKARAGDEAAIHDLFAEYGYDASAEPRPQLPTTEEQQRNKKQKEK